MQDLGTLAGDVFSTAIGINDAGEIVGVSADANFDIRAFVRLNAQLQDLNSLIAGDTPLYLLLACSINSSGQIIGLAFDTTTKDLHGYLATPNYGAAAQPIYPAPRPSSKTAFAADLRRLLQQLRFGRFGAGPTRAR
jgi:probable HAF family extracellular repeat protein